MSYKLHTVGYALMTAALLMSSVAHAQKADYFPTFDMASMLKISEECPLELDSGETLRLVDYYGSEVQSLIEKLGPPEYVSAMLYLSIYPYAGFAVISGIMDLYHEMEVPVKIYEWPKSSIYVFCIRNGEQFEYPYELTRFYGTCIKNGKLPLEEWLASESGDSGWYVLAWRNERRKDMDKLERFKYVLPNDGYRLPNKFFNPEFIFRFTFDSFNDFYFRTMKLSYFVPKPYRDKCLSEFAGMTYKEFCKIVGTPSFELYTIDGNVSYDTLHVTWPLRNLLSGYDACQIKICSYERNGSQLFVYFVDWCGSWRLVYADIAPVEPPYIEF